ncbi:ATP-binding protein [Jannaschia donghaensis]|uniref:histidine kinase n=1 Tax=Jannaschia donghaensis TaxID=420998 RepID=A0A0M6YJ18_9RHOB|nr:ATP-binding protein [Jannaschia donghaensis]CTQ50351.1 Blue-light-activated protein [Jannaschia donghaensis]
MEQTRDTALLNALMDASVDAIVVADAGGRILRINRAAEALFRHPDGSLTGLPLDILMPRDMAERHQGFVRTYLETGVSNIIGIGRDLIGQRADGTTFPLHVSIGEAKLDQETIFVGIMHDQSRRRAAEEALNRSQRMDAIGRMTGGVAHDFNNLLTIIVGNLELLEMGETTPREDALITDALSAAQMGADLTSRLLLFARKGELKPVSLDLDDTIEDTLRLLRRTLSANCDVEHRTHGTPWKVKLDPVQLQTAIINLALNAQDAMPDGGRLRLEVENIEVDDDYVAQDTGILPGRYVRLSVSDTGKGMTADQRLRALEPFFTTKPPGKGTGLGLSMVYGYVRQSGGHLTLYSEVGKGTAVSMYFPRDHGSVALTAPVATPSKPFGNGRLVLVVEDDPLVRRLTLDRIAALGFEVTGAETADEAWAVLSGRTDIALVFSDLVMPGDMTGEDLARRIVADRPGLPVLLTSGFSGGMANLEGIDGHPPLLRKPYRQADLARAMRDILKTAP